MMEKEQAQAIALELLGEAKTAYLGTIDKHGFPNIKAMLNLYNDGLKTFLFTTHSSSKHVKQIKRNNKGCIYFADENKFVGLMLVGTFTVSQDKELREKVWRSGFEMFYSKGVEDPDHSVIVFKAFKANIYKNLTNMSFEID